MYVLFVSIGITGITGPTCSLATLVRKLHGKNDVKPNIHDTIWLHMIYEAQHVYYKLHGHTYGTTTCNMRPNHNAYNSNL